MGGVGGKRYWELKCDIENKTPDTQSSYRGKRGKPKVDTVAESWLALLYNRTSNEIRKEYHSIPPTLAAYTIHPPPGNHSLCSDVPSESHRMILHTTTITPYQYNHATLSNVATPQTTILSQQIIPPPSHWILRISQLLCSSVIQFLPQHPRIPIIIPKYLGTSSNLNIPCAESVSIDLNSLNVTQSNWHVHTN